MKLKLLIGAAIGAAGLAFSAGAAEAQAAGVSGELCGNYDVTNGFNIQSAGTVCIPAVRYSYRAGEGNKVTVVPGNSNFSFAPTTSGPNPRINNCRFRNGISLGGGGGLKAGSGSRLVGCDATTGNGGNRGTDEDIQLRFKAGNGPAVVAGERRQLCGEYDVTNGFGNRSAGTVCITADLYNYGVGESRKVLALPNASRFTFTENTGRNPRMRCSFRTSGNSFGGGGYLAAGSGTRADCTATTGNGGNRASVDVEMRLR